MDETCADRKHVFILGLDDFHRSQLCRMRGAERYSFHSLLEVDDLFNRPEYQFDELLGRCVTELDCLDRRPDGISGYWDFPTCDLIPVLAEHYGLPGPSLEAVLKCEHKYWSRTEQQAVAPDLVPRFQMLDPFDPRAADGLSLEYPLWLKPVRSHSSFLGFRVCNRVELERGLQRIRDENIAGEPFNRLLDRVDTPSEIRAAGGTACVVEELMSGYQCTAEGYVVDGEVYVYGVIDSIRSPNRSSFERYQYPSRLPGCVRERIDEACRRVLQGIGLNHTAFNIEFFYDPQHDRLQLLEINPRISQSHSELFALVDGVPNSQVIVELAAGDEPSMPHREGPFPVAAKFMVRTYRDGIVARVPTPEDIAAVEMSFPGARVTVDVCEGMRLSDLPWQDSYSYELAQIYLGASNTAELAERYEHSVRMLNFRLDGE